MSKKALKNKQKMPRKTGHTKRKKTGIPHKLRQATQLHNNGQLTEAAKIYQEILAVEPNNPDALNLSGLIALHRQNFDGGQQLIERAIKICPQMPSFHANLGLAYSKQKHFHKARLSVLKSIELQPDNGSSFFQLGNIERELKNETEAISCYRKSLSFAPDSPHTLTNLANSLTAIGEYTEAITSYQKALQIDPLLAEAYLNMGNTYKDIDDYEKARSCYRKAIEIRHDYPDPYNNIGYTLQHQGKLTEALEYFHKALEYSPKNSDILLNTGNIYRDIGKLEKAISHFKKALALNSGNQIAHSNILFTMNYTSKILPEAMFKEAQNWWKQQAAHIANKFSHSSEQTPQKQLKIGFVSSDFRVHSVSYFITALLEEINKNKFESFCYGDIKKTDWMTEKIKQQSDHWLNILGMSDEAVAQQIHQDKIDILVDLAGHTAGNRLHVFAQKPAPVQVTWLGYPNTTGLPTIDYRITDEISDPSGESDKFYTETLVRLPEGFLCYAPPTDAPSVTKPPAESSGQITFGSFNNLTKTGEEVISTWADILTQVPSSRLILKNLLFIDEQIKERFLLSFEKHGVSRERIDLLQRTFSPVDHLATYNKIDIGLDPFPYNGTTTTCESMWMGVPVVTLKGNRHSSRVGASILSQTGFPELIASSKKEYINAAVSLANDIERLASIRQNLRSQVKQSSLCDKNSFARKMENAFQTMWNKWCDPKNNSTSFDAEAADYNKEGEDFFNQGNLQDALKLFQKAVQADPDFAPAYNNLGVLFSHTGKLDSALEYFNRAISINPLDQVALDNTGDILEMLKKEKKPPLKQNNQSKEEIHLILCTGMPRSGSTWSFNVCRELLQGSYKEKKINATYIGDENLLDEYILSHKDDDNIHLLKTHYPTPKAAQLITEGKAINVYTIRHPLAAVASSKEVFKTPISHAAESIKKSLEIFNNLKDTPGSIHIEFDKIFECPHEQIRRIATQLNLSPDERLIAKVHEKTSFKKSKEITKNLSNKKNSLIQAGDSFYDPQTLLHINHLPKGQKRSWSTELTQEEQSIAKKILSPYLSRWQEPDTTQENLSKSELQKKIDSFPFWYHKIELPNDIITPGWAPLKPSAYQIPTDLTGKRVLDIGSWDGYWTFEALKRGAKEVVAIDDFSDYLGKLEERDRKAWETFDLCKNALGYSDERCKRVELSIYDLKEETFGHFDIVFFFGTLYHLRYPLLALDKIAAVCDEALYVESAILDDYSPYRGGLHKGYSNENMIMEFYPGKEYGANDSNWWTPTLRCMVNMLAAAGFHNCRGWKLVENPQELSTCRGFAHGCKKKIAQENKTTHQNKDSKENDAESMNQLGVQFQNKGDLCKALDSFNKAASLAPDNPRFQVNIGVILIDQQNYTEAIIHLRQAISLKQDLAEAHFNLGNALAHSDSLNEAMSSYRKAIQLKPNLPSAHANLAATLNSLNQHEEAAKILQKQLAITPDDINTLNNLGYTFYCLGEMEKAIVKCESALKYNPTFANAHNTIGLAHTALNNLSAAVEAFTQAIDSNPNFIEAINNLGLVYAKMQDSKKAIEYYKRGLEIDAGKAEIHCNLAIALTQIGKVHDAIKAYGKALKIKPDYAAAINNLAQAYFSLGEYETAEDHFLRASKIDPTDPTILANLGILKTEQVETTKALSYFMRALKLEPENTSYLQQMALCLSHISPAKTDTFFEKNLITCLSSKGIYKDPLTAPATALIKQGKDYAAAITVSGDSEKLAAAIQEGRLAITENQLFLLMLQNAVITDPDLEQLLTRIRSVLLLHPATAQPTQALTEFVCALAHQCFINEYIYFQNTNESNAIQVLKKNVEHDLRQGGDVSPFKIFLLGSYTHLFNVQGAQILMHAEQFKQQDTFTQLITKQVEEPLLEKKIYAGIKEISPINNSVSKLVQKQYEENPYPRWIDIPITGPSNSFGLRLQQKLPYVSFAEMKFIENPNILVAGCGTGREAIQSAIIYSDAKVTAVDLSRTSLAYATRKAREYNITNVNFLHGDILELKKLNQQFDIIESSGVLHHMDEPLKGWQVLTDILKPGGFMKIALYSEIARQPIVAARHFIAQQSYTTSPEDIRECRQAVFNKPQDDLIKKIQRSKDFYTMSQCRDLIFHIQEHRFTTLQIREAVDHLGLTFLGFVSENSQLRSQYKHHFPHDTTCNNLENWHEFENKYPDSFLGMYTFWLYKAPE